MLIICDPHGHAKTLHALLKKAHHRVDSERVVINGDLIDRGPDSAELVEDAIRYGWRCTRGNHEQLMIDACRRAKMGDLQCWHQNDAETTLQSYKRWPLERMEAHLDWMESLPLFRHYNEPRESDGRTPFVSHAGLYKLEDLDGNTVPWADAAESLSKNRDILWHRDPLHDYPDIFQVVGHTPQGRGPVVAPHFVKMDLGACYVGRQGYGQLAALRWPDMEFIVQETLS